MNTTEMFEWVNLLEGNPCHISKDDFEYHLSSGHIPIDEPRVLGLLVRFSREAHDIIEAVRTGNMRSGDSANTAMKVRLRAIELAAQIKGILGIQRSQKIIANVDLHLDESTKKQMAQEALRQIDMRALRGINKEPENVDSNA